MAPLSIILDVPDASRPLFTDTTASGERDLSRWEVPFGGVDLVTGFVPGPTGASRKTDYINLGGSEGRPGILQTAAPLLFLPEVKYRLDFSYNSVEGTPEEAWVRIAGEMFHLRSEKKSFVKQRFLFSFPESTLARLIFQGMGHGHGGIGIDNVSITLVAPPREP
ncbi:hypothetical protein BH11ARM2_BH11ARM2_30840 [soil metagenome]